MNRNNNNGLLNEHQELKGVFYRPDFPNIKVAGVLTYNPNGKIELEIIGSSLSDTEQFYHARRYEIIHGIIKTEDGVKKISLLNCYDGGAQYNIIQGEQFIWEKYTCQFILIGKHIESLNSPVFKKIKFTFPYFTEWYQPSEIQKIPSDNTDEIRFIGWDSGTPMNPCPIKDYLTLNFNTQFRNCGSSRYKKTLLKQTYIEIESEQSMGFLYLFAEALWFKDFFSFATMHPTVFSSICLLSDEDYEERNGIRIPNDIEFLYIAEEMFNLDFTLQKTDFLFVWKEIQNDFLGIINKWYVQKEDIEPILQPLIQSVIPSVYFRPSDFLTIIQAVEGYYNRFINDGESLTSIIDSLYCSFSTISIVANNRAETKKVVDSRHHYSHILPKGKKKDALKDWDLYELTDRLRPLLLCCILSLIGFEKGNINTVVQRYYEWPRSSYIKT